MAEIAIKVGDQGVSDLQYRDGDIIAAFSDRRIGLVHASHLCDCRVFGFNSAGLRDRNTLAEKMLLRTRKYVFQRVSKTEVKRINLLTLEEDVFSSTPNANGEHMHVELFIARRKANARHSIFGAEGAEIWYGGKTTQDATTVDDIWSDIEQHSADRRVDHTLWPAGYQDIREHLIVRTDDFSPAEEIGFVAPQYQLDDNGDKVLGAEGEAIVTSKRVVKTDWTEILGDLGVTAAQVRDKAHPVGKVVRQGNKPIRYASKDQPKQADRSRLKDKDSGSLGA